MSKHLISGSEFIPVVLVHFSHNKDFKRHRKFNSRKCSTVMTIEDIFISSDLQISVKSKIKNKNLRQFPTENISLLKAPIPTFKNFCKNTQDAFLIYISSQLNAFDRVSVIIFPIFPLYQIPCRDFVFI